MGTKQIVPAVKAFIVKDGKALLLHKDPKSLFHSLYDIPGGKIEFGEEPLDALEREVFEETNLKIKIIKPITMTTILKHDTFHIIGTVFLCHSTGEIKLSKEHTHYEWVDVDKIKTKEYPEWLRNIAKKI